MKPKIYVAIALMLALLVAGVIIILGISTSALLSVYLLLFFLIYSAIAIISMRKVLENKIFAACIILILLSISATFFLTSLKSYNVALKVYGDANNAPEISLMQTENTYYSVYADYLNQIVLQYQSNNKILENQLTQLKQLRLDQAMQQAILQGQQQALLQTQQQTLQQELLANATSQVITVPETSYITYSYPNNGGVNDD